MADKGHFLDKSAWFWEDHIQPYAFVRPENRIQQPGSRHSLNWFNSKQVVFKNPLDLSELEFAEQIYHIENHAFGPTNMAMPRWVFYDCAVMPGFVAGFAMKTEKMPDWLKKVVRYVPGMDWAPISLFIIIPSMRKGEWVAHNLCSVNSLLPREHQFYGLGFLSKAFGLWYANVETCCGFTQWASPARKLHTHYGPLEVLACYTPVHSHAETLTYRLKVNTECWDQFYTREPDLEFLENYKSIGLSIDPKLKDSLIATQRRVELGEGPYFLSAQEIATKPLDAPLNLYSPKNF